MYYGVALCGLVHWSAGGRVSEHFCCFLGLLWKHILPLKRRKARPTGPTSSHYPCALSSPRDQSLRLHRGFGNTDVLVSLGRQIEIYCNVQMVCSDLPFISFFHYFTKNIKVLSLYMRQNVAVSFSSETGSWMLKHVFSNLFDWCLYGGSCLLIFLPSVKNKTYF